MDPRTAKTSLFSSDGISWIGLVAGPLAWSIDEYASYPIVGWSCQVQRPLVTHGVTVVALALIIAGALLSWRKWRQQGAAAMDQNRPPARLRFLSLGSLLLCLLFGLAVLIDTAAKFAFDPCQR